jgi:SulP family sulfate permease
VTIGSKYGEIKAGFYPINFAGISNVKFSALIVPAIVIAFLCAIESLLSATVASGMTNTTFNSNQELVGQGVANIFSSLLGGLPATGAIARTAAGIENGAKSPLTGVFHSIFVLIMYFALMGVMQYIPLCVFSAILISVAINMSRFKLFGKLCAFGVRDSIILIATCALTIIFDLTYGVLGGVAITLIANIKTIKTGLKMETDLTDDKKVIRLNGAATFVNASKMAEYISNELEDISKVTIDMSQLSSIDETSLEKLAVLNKKIRLQKKELEIIGASSKVDARIQKFMPVL